MGHVHSRDSPKDDRSSDPPLLEASEGAASTSEPVSLDMSSSSSSHPFLRSSSMRDCSQPSSSKVTSHDDIKVDETTSGIKDEQEMESSIKLLPDNQVSKRSCKFLSYE